MANLIKAILTLFKCKFDFKKVKKEKMLIFDTMSLLLVSKFKNFWPNDKSLTSKETLLLLSKFKKFEILDVRYEILDVRYKVFNFWVLLENFMNLKFTFKDYILTFISKVNPKVVLTYNDNYPLFYELKNYFPKVKFIAVQNGYRHKSQLNDFKNHNNYLYHP